jgi:phosphatidate cytidylyltransferase
MAAKDATAPLLGPANPRKLLWRIVSAIVMAPPVLAAVWFGAPWLDLLALLAVAGMGWEWGRLCSRGRFAVVGALVLLTGVSSVIVLVLGVHPAIAPVLVALGGALIVVAMAAVTREAEPGWAGIGTLWLTLGGVGFLWLAMGPHGRDTALWLLAVVWATDIGAYVVGRTVGGPRLAPRISPQKTWAGLIGAMAGAAGAGLIAARLTGAPGVLLLATSMALAVIAQLGDLAESLAKRHFGVKDSSGLIPGHGGLMDRLDAFVTACLFAAVAAGLNSSGSFIASGLFQW